MKRRVLALIVCMAMTLSACGNPEESGKKEPAPKKETEQEIEQEIEKETVKVEQEEVKIENEEQEEVDEEVDEEGFTAKQRGMESLMYSVMVYMYGDEGMPYSAEEPETFWTIMHHGIGMVYNVSEEDMLEYIDEGIMRLESALVREYAGALFENVEELPEIPEGMERVSYDPETDTYLIGEGEAGLVEDKLLSWEENGDGTYTVKAELSDVADLENVDVYSFRFIMKDNPNADSIENPHFYYTIVSVEQIQ